MKNDWRDLEKMVDNGTNHVHVSHVFQGNFFGKRGRDKCLEILGVESDECRSYNKKYDSDNSPNVKDKIL